VRERSVDIGLAPLAEASEPYLLGRPPRVQLVFDITRGRPGLQPRATSRPEEERREFRIVLDPGHGGTDNGVRAPFGQSEKNLALRIAEALGSHLESELGARVVLTRNGDSTVTLENRTSLANQYEADLFVFAGGPWLAELFPGFDPPLVSPTRQEILYFGTPPGRPDLTDAELPVWVETGASLFYGVPGSNFRGFKVADDSRGAPFDPTDGDRTPSPEAIETARNYMERRFPAMRGAPLVEARVCQYEQSADGHLIVDTHPEAANAWIAGGGSGHSRIRAPLDTRARSARRLEASV